MRTVTSITPDSGLSLNVGMKPLSERDENSSYRSVNTIKISGVGMKPLSERDENLNPGTGFFLLIFQP